MVCSALVTVTPSLVVVEVYTCTTPVVNEVVVAEAALEAVDAVAEVDEDVAVDAEEDETVEAEEVAVEEEAASGEVLV